MKSLLDVPAPAKLNLFLHVTGRRNDGYHLIQSAFMLLDWHDVLHFEVRSDGQITREDLAFGLPDDDLCVRAAKSLQRAASSPLGVHIGIRKQIPVQAGMGGGSSDAATCLLALNRLWGLGWSVEQLIQVGVTLGADVPFFLGGHNAWVEGIGERLHQIRLPPGRFAVVKPKGGLETARIFADPELKRDTQTAIISGFAADPYGFGHNDLQPVALRLCPDVSLALEWLGRIGLKPRMTGSGSAVFAPIGQDADLPQAPWGWEVRKCRNLEVHPLWGWATSDNSSVDG